MESSKDHKAAFEPPLGCQVMQFDDWYSELRLYMSLKTDSVGGKLDPDLWAENA